MKEGRKEGREGSNVALSKNRILHGSESESTNLEKFIWHITLLSLCWGPLIDFSLVLTKYNKKNKKYLQYHVIIMNLIIFVSLCSGITQIRKCIILTFTSLLF